MESNPYAAPRASLDVTPADRDDLERQKASRGRRLAAVLIDSATFFLALIPIFIFAPPGQRTSGSSAAGFGALLVILVLAIVNLTMLYRSGQTIGKRLMGTKIVRTDGSRASLGRIILLRIIPMQLLSGIPYLGALIALADALVIFGKDVRCLHDQIADTIVIDA